MSLTPLTPPVAAADKTNGLVLVKYTCGYWEIGELTFTRVSRYICAPNLSSIMTLKF